MTQPAKSQEPSMEEILASIRRIIADDDASKTPQRSPRAAEAGSAGLQRRRHLPPEPEPIEPEVEAPEPVDEAAEQDQNADILDLTESMAAPQFQ